VRMAMGFDSMPHGASALELVRKADQAIFRATRSLKDTPRWALAQNDVAQAVPDLMRDFSCAAGADLTPQKAPRLNALFSRVGLDVVTAVNRPKDLYKRQRPYLIGGGETCIPQTDALAASPDYPSGHATWGWTAGLILAELAPDRATDILVRGRAYGESRVVCGVHSASAVEEARTNASALVAALHGDAAFRADLDRARREMGRLRAMPPPLAQACAAEATLTAKPPW